MVLGYLPWLTLLEQGVLDEVISGGRCQTKQCCSSTRHNATQAVITLCSYIIRNRWKKTRTPKIWCNPTSSVPWRSHKTETLCTKPCSGRDWQHHLISRNFYFQATCLGASAVLFQGEWKIQSHSAARSENKTRICF